MTKSRDVWIREDRPEPPTPRELGAIDIRIDDPSHIPPDILAQLIGHESALQSTRYVEDLIKGSLRAAESALDRFIRRNYVIGYHATREPEPGCFQREGLRMLNRAAHQEDFINRHGHRFSSQQRDAMRAAWCSYFPGAQDQSRNGMVHFYLTRDLLLDAQDPKYFFGYFGGEAIHMPLEKHPDIMATLSAIGFPVVVVARLNPTEIRSRDFGCVALSYYHRSVHPSAHVWNPVTNLMRNLLPDEIVAVVPRHQWAALP